MVDERRAAYLRAYELFEDVQSEQQAAAVAALPDALKVAGTQGWREVEFVLEAAGVVHALVGRDGPIGAVPEVQGLVTRAEALDAPALLAVALGLRGLAASSVGDAEGLMSDASRAVALLDDASQPPLDRSTGYVVTAAAFNTLRLWELVDELYILAGDVEQDCPVPVQAAAIAVNRVLTRVEWALALLENGDEEQAQLRMTQALEAVPAAVGQRLPPLWRRNVEALSAVAELLRDASAPVVPQSIAQQRQALVDDKDIEVLPLLDAATALAFWRAGQVEQAAAAVDRLTATSSVSSGARSFPAWVRAHVLAGQEPSAAVRAQQDHANLLSRLRWESREAVLAAARTHIAAERRQGEHDRLSRAVNTDPLTGLHNRRVFDAWLDRRAPGRARPTALLLVDLDDFKTVNDTFGHDYGDEVLRRFGRLLLTSIRPGDLAVRHGGDEFALLLEDERLTVAAAQHRARDLRDAILGEPWPQLAPGLVVTASIGMAVAVPMLDAALVDAAGLYRAADTALYTAKRDGSGLAVHVLPGDEADKTTGQHREA